MIVRLVLGISAFLAAYTALTVSPAAAQNAQSTPVVVQIPGPCMVAFNNQPAQCVGVAYTASPDTGRVMFTAIGPQGGLSFSGDRDNNEDGHYTLMLDSVLSRGAGVLNAEGRCEMDMAQDAVTVRSIECQARTAAGAMMLKAAGVAKTGAAPKDNDDDDDDDDEDDGPDILPT